MPNPLVLTPSRKEKELLGNFLPSSYPISEAGVGLISPFFKLQSIDFQLFDFIILTGIAGGSPELNIGECYEVTQHSILDIGTETAEGGFLSITELQLDPEQHYHSIQVERSTSLNQIHDYTVPTCTGTQQTYFRRYQNKSGVSESMESFPIVSFLTKQKIPFVHLRGISNHIGERNLAEWQILPALKSCAQYISTHY